MFIAILILVGLIFLGLLIAVLVMQSRTKKKHPTDYYSFFVIGIIWMAFGMFSFFRERELGFLFIMGLGFAAVGLVHKKDWKKNSRTWKQLSKEEKKFGLWVIIILSALVVFGLVAFLYQAARL